MNTTLKVFFFFNDTATTEIYTLSLHDALPISASNRIRVGKRILARRAQHAAEYQPGSVRRDDGPVARRDRRAAPDRKSTRLNSSHANISYAVFCLKKKKIILYHSITRLTTVYT